MFIIEYCQLTETPNIFKVPKKVPEEKVPVPVQKKEAPPAKGTSSLLNLNFLLIFFYQGFMCDVSVS